MEKISNEVTQEDFRKLENMNCHTGKAHQVPRDSG